MLGVLMVGRRLDGRVVRSVDLPFLEALGATAGLALARLQLARRAGRGVGGGAAGRGVSRLPIGDRGRRAARMRLRVGLHRHGSPEAARPASSA